MKYMGKIKNANSVPGIAVEATWLDIIEDN